MKLTHDELHCIEITGCLIETHIGPAVIVMDRLDL